MKTLDIWIIYSSKVFPQSESTVYIFSSNLANYKCEAIEKNKKILIIAQSCEKLLFASSLNLLIKMLLRCYTKLSSLPLFEYTVKLKTAPIN